MCGHFVAPRVKKLRRRKYPEVISPPLVRWANDVLLEFVGRDAEKQVSKANSDAAIEYYRSYLAYQKAKADYDDAEARGDLDAMVEHSANEMLRHEILEGKVRKPGRQKLSGNETANRHAASARACFAVLRNAWSRGPTKTKYARATACDLIEGFFDKCLGLKLKSGWEKQH